MLILAIIPSGFHHGVHVVRILEIVFAENENEQKEFAGENMAALVYANTYGLEVRHPSCRLTRHLSCYLCYLS